MPCFILFLVQSCFLLALALVLLDWNPGGSASRVEEERDVPQELTLVDTPTSKTDRFFFFIVHVILKDKNGIC